MDRPEFWLWWTALKVIVILFIAAIVIFGLSSPRLVPLIVVTLLGAAVLLWIYRDRFTRRD